MLSPESRAELQRRAEDLRTEISDLNAERDAARMQNAASVNDAKLIAEVQALEAQRNAAEKERDQALLSSGDAIAVMEQAIEAQALATTQANAGSSTPVREVDVYKEDLPDAEELKADAKEAAAEPAPSAEPAEVTESASATNTKKGGNR